MLGWRRPKCPGGHKRAARPCSPPELGVFSLFLPSFFSVPSEESWAAAACCFRVPLSKDEVLAGSLGEVSSELPTVAVTDDVGGGSYCCA